MFLARALSRVLCVLSALAWVGCSENFGLAPPDGGRRIAVTAEEPTGPVRPRSVIAVTTGGDRVFVGTDGGLFAGPLTAGAMDWSAVHPGFLGGDGFERTASIDAVATDASGRLVLHVARVTPVYAIVCSRDGGRTHEPLPLPDPLIPTVGSAAVLGPTANWPSGAWVVQQGTEVFVRALDADTWQRVRTPQSPTAVRRLRALHDGRLVLVVSLSGADAVWVNAHASPFDMTEVLRTPRALLDANLEGEAWIVAHAEGLDRGPDPWVRWPGHTVVRAGTASEGAGVRWTLVGRDAGGAERLASGTTAATIGSATALGGSTTAVDLQVVRDVAVFVAREGGSDRVVVVRGAPDAPSIATRDARFVEIDARAITVLDPSNGTIVVGSEFQGEAFAGPSSDPDAFVQLGIGPLSSLVTSLATDPVGRIVAGSFGVHRFDPDLARWRTENLGQSSYQPGDFGGPVVVRALHLDARGALWLGADNGDGVYRARPFGADPLEWERLHDGFGEPGTFAAESGLPAVTQARAFALDAGGRPWMGGFRGGAWVFDEEALRWSGANEGLPDLAGAVYDSCCVVPGEREIDVRDLVTLDDGTLLAATAWGVFAREPGAARWQDRSLGLTTRDVTVLAVHPRRTGTVALGVNASAPDRDGRWLYLTEDVGRTWFPVDVATLARDAVDLVWSRPDRMELVALLRARGALRVELAP